MRRDAEGERDRAKTLYRHLRDHVGAEGASTYDLVEALGEGWTTTRVLMSMQWLRIHGVSVVCARFRQRVAPDGALRGEELQDALRAGASRWALRERLPESWDAMLPAVPSTKVLFVEDHAPADGSEAGRENRAPWQGGPQ